MTDRSKDEDPRGRPTRGGATRDMGAPLPGNTARDTAAERTGGEARDPGDQPEPRPRYDR